MIFLFPLRSPIKAQLFGNEMWLPVIYSVGLLRESLSLRFLKTWFPSVWALYNISIILLLVGVLAKYIWHSKLSQSNVWHWFLNALCGVVGMWKDSILLPLPFVWHIGNLYFGMAGSLWFTLTQFLVFSSEVTRFNSNFTRGWVDLGRRRNTSCRARCDVYSEKQQFQARLLVNLEEPVKNCSNC